MMPRAMSTDPKRLQQILKNLLSNAFKFTAQGQVTITAGKNADKGAQAKWTLADRIIKRTNEIREIIQKAEAPTFDTTKVLGKLMQQAGL